MYPWVAGKHVGPYLLISCVGSGGMGEVWKARDTRLDRVVAIKRLNAEHRGRLDQEARAIAALNHSHICRLYDVGPEYLVMEFIDGKPIQGPLPPREAVELAIQIASALHETHLRGILHRDLKPTNIMVSADGSVKLLDFGLAIRAARTDSSETRRTLEGSVLGTAAYVSPEQAEGRQLDPRSDIFSFGAVLYEMFSGNRAFGGSSTVQILSAVLRDEPPPLKIPAAHERIVRRCLAKQPENRFQSVLELKTALEEVQRGVVDEVRTDEGPEEGRVVLLYKRGVTADEQVLLYLERELKAAGLPVFIDRHMSAGLLWADGIARRIEKAIAVIGLLSEDSMKSDMLSYELHLARKTAQLNDGRPRILLVRVLLERPLRAPFDVFQSIQHAIWNGPEDNARLLEVLISGIKRPVQQLPRYAPPVGGALSPSDPFYIERFEDTRLKEAIQRRDTIVRVQGARQMGKTSMLARALKNARSTGVPTVYMDFQKMNATELKDTETFYRSVIDWLCDELDLSVNTDQLWKSGRAPNTILHRFVQKHCLLAGNSHLIWAMDEVDRLFSTAFSSEFFGLLRTWHNARNMNPDEGWDRLTILIAYATEPWLFITNLDQSPFNVGQNLDLPDFTPGELRRLNDMHSSPLVQDQVQALFQLLGGQPYLLRRAFYEFSHGLTFDQFAATADQDGGPFGDHLRRILVVLARDPDLTETVRQALAGKPMMAADHFYRLRRAGIFKGKAPSEARPRCELYATYLKRHLV